MKIKKKYTYNHIVSSLPGILNNWMFHKIDNSLKQQLSMAMLVEYGAGSFLYGDGGYRRIRDFKFVDTADPSVLDLSIGYYKPIDVKVSI
jgi:hypothetical protein